MDFKRVSAQFSLISLSLFGKSVKFEGTLISNYNVYYIAAPINGQRFVEQKFHALQDNFITR